MDTYHRWMEVVIGPTLAGLPSISVPVGFNAAGLPMGLQIIGPAQAHPLLQLHNFLFTKFPDGHSTSPLSATSLCGPGRVHAKSGGKAPPGCGILELFPNNSE